MGFLAMGKKRIKIGGKIARLLVVRGGGDGGEPFFRVASFFVRGATRPGKMFRFMVADLLFFFFVAGRV